MTKTTETAYARDVRGNKPGQIREDLDVAVDGAIAFAMKIGRHGVLVTQHSYAHYTVALDAGVPYGQIREQSLQDTGCDATRLSLSP
jgi:hypothetical protein